MEKEPIAKIRQMTFKYLIFQEALDKFKDEFHWQIELILCSSS